MRNLLQLVSLISCLLTASSGPSSPPLSRGSAHLPISTSMGSLRPSYNERLPVWSNRPGPGVVSSSAPHRPTSLDCNFHPTNRQFLSPFDTSNQCTSQSQDYWQNGYISHTKSINCRHIMTPTFVVTPPEAETASTHAYLEVPATKKKCFNDPSPDEICKCEKEAMKSKHEARQGVDGSAQTKPPSSPVNWKAEVIRQYRERLEQKQSQDLKLKIEPKQQQNGPSISCSANDLDNALDTSSTCSTLEADCDSFSSSSYHVNDACTSPDAVASGENCAGNHSSAVMVRKQGKLTEEERSEKIREVDEIVSSLESIPATFNEVNTDGSVKYRLLSTTPPNSIKTHDNNICRYSFSGGKWRDDFFSSMLNLDLTKLNDHSCSSSCKSSSSVIEDISPRDLIFGCGRVAELARHFTLLGESEKCYVRRSKSEPDISPRTDKGHADSDYTVVYSVGLKAVDFSIDHNSNCNPQVAKVQIDDTSEDSVSSKNTSFNAEKVNIIEQTEDVCRNCESPCDHHSSGSEDSNSPWVQLRRLLQAESGKSESISLNPDEDFEDTSSDLNTEPSTNMWARMKKLVKGNGVDGSSEQVSTSWSYRSDNKSLAQKNKPERKAGKKSLDSSYLSLDITAQVPGMKSSLSETCLASSSPQEQPCFSLKGERSRSEEALLMKKKPKRRVVFSCVKENSDGEKSPSIQRYSVTKPHSPDHETSSVVRRYSVTKPQLSAQMRPKFPEAYIRTRSCQSVEDSQNKTENTKQQTLARQFGSMPHIMQPMYIGGHTHLIPSRANSDEMICRHLHCPHLNSYFHQCESLQTSKACLHSNALASVELHTPWNIFSSDNS